MKTILIILFIFIYSYNIAQKEPSKPSFRGETESYPRKGKKSSRNNQSEKEYKSYLKEISNKFYSERWNKNAVLKTSIGLFPVTNYFDKNFKWNNKLLINIPDLYFHFNEKNLGGIGLTFQFDKSNISDSIYSNKAKGKNIFTSLKFKRYFITKFDNMRLYTCVGLNYIITTNSLIQYSLSNNKPIFYRNNSDVYVNFIFRLGFDLLLNEWFGVYCDAGLGSSYINFGISARF